MTCRQLLCVVWLEMGGGLSLRWARVGRGVRPWRWAMQGRAAGRARCVVPHPSGSVRGPGPSSALQLFSINPKPCPKPCCPHAVQGLTQVIAGVALLATFAGPALGARFNSLIGELPQHAARPCHAMWQPCELPACMSLAPSPSSPRRRGGPGECRGAGPCVPHHPGSPPGGPLRAGPPLRLLL